MCRGCKLINPTPGPPGGREILPLRDATRHAAAVHPSANAKRAAALFSFCPCFFELCSTSCEIRIFGCELGEAGWRERVELLE